MHKKILILCSTVSFILVTNLFLLKSSAHTKIHNNHLYFTGIHNVSFTVKQHCISPGQPYGTPDGSLAVPVKHLGMVGITIKAGRHATDKTVNCTAANLIDSSASFGNNFTFSTDLGEGWPNNLNFAVKGTLVINGKFFDGIILAQGHNNTRNNWWFGGNKCLTVISDDPDYNKEQVECTARDETHWCFIRGSTNKWTSNAPDHVKVQTRTCTL